MLLISDHSTVGLPDGGTSKVNEPVEIDDDNVALILELLENGFLIVGDDGTGSIDASKQYVQEQASQTESTKTLSNVAESPAATTAPTEAADAETPVSTAAPDPKPAPAKKRKPAAKKK